MSMISVKGLQKSFGKHEVLKGIDIEIQPGEVVAIVGPSGCGKSTFLRCLNLLEKPTGGQILYHDVDLVSADARSAQPNAPLVSGTRIRVGMANFDHNGFLRTSAASVVGRGVIITATAGTGAATAGEKSQAHGCRESKR